MMDNKFIYTSSTNINSQNEVQSGDRNKYIFYSSENPKDIYTLARAFLSISEMTNKKLQKLCYYAKAWYLALYDVNLISEQFQAWVHGAVQPTLYQKYKAHGFNLIPKVSNTSDIPEEFLSFAKEVYESYGHLTGDELERLNHTEEPWKKARGDCEPWENCDKEISENDMKEYFRAMM